MSSQANFYSRLEARRFAGFQAFTANKAFAVTDAVPDGHVWIIFGLSGYHSVAGAVRIVHFFAIPPGEADRVINPLSDVASPIFLGANNNPPLRAGVLVSVGGSSGLADMQSLNSSSVNGLINFPFFLPERWKILAFIDSNEAVVAGDGVVIDLAYIDVASGECIPDFL